IETTDRLSKLAGRAQTRDWRAKDIYNSSPLVASRPTTSVGTSGPHRHAIERRSIQRYEGLRSSPKWIVTRSAGLVVLSNRAHCCLNIENAATLCHVLDRASLNDPPSIDFRFVVRAPGIQSRLDAPARGDRTGVDTALVEEPVAGNPRKI